MIDIVVPMSLLSTAGNERCYIVIYPNIAIKNIHITETHTQEVYAKWPTIDYYKNYTSGAVPRATPGTVKVYTPEELGGNIGVVVVNYRLYPGNKVFPNDNETTRLKYFRTAFEMLQNDARINILHIEVPNTSPEYARIIEDYKTTCLLLRNSAPAIHIHGKTDDDENESTNLPLMFDVPRQVVKYRLNVKQECVGQTVLYAADFSPYTVRMDNGILKYFPTDPKWKCILDDPQLCKFACDVGQALESVINNVFPPKEDIFNAFKLIRGDIRVVILGQDPYHSKPGQAHGLSFSVPRGISVPPSLRNVYTALENDVGCTRVEHGCLEEWAQQGVLLLNTSLTVLQGQPNCHTGIWQNFTDRLIQLIANKYDNVVFLLWGEAAKKKRKLVAVKDHCILEFNHPSPQVIGNTFGTQCKHFSQTNTYLTSKGYQPINWQLSQ